MLNARTFSLCVFITAVGLGACIGDIGGTGGKNGDSNSNEAEEMSAESLPLRRLNRFEIDRSLQLLLGDTSGAARKLSDTASQGGFDTLADDLTVNSDRYTRLETIFVDAATRAMGGDQKKFLGCEMHAAGDACFKSFVKSFGRRALRHSLSEEETARFVMLESTLEAPSAADKASPRAEAIARTVSAILLSPGFLYLTSIGDQGNKDAQGNPRLTSLELASRLSYFLWGGPPDDELLDAAESGKLSSDADIAKEVDRMLASPRFGDGAAAFILSWLEVNSLPEQSRSVPNWNAQMAERMLQETAMFGADWARTSAPTLASLLTADYTYADKSLAEFYGLTAPSGSGFSRIDGIASQGRRGLLTQGAFLASQSLPMSTAPTLRGRWVMKNLLCESLGAAPADALQKSPTLKEGMSTREWHEAIAATPGCGGCHNRTDPIGFVFEGFDQAGRPRATDAGKPVLTSATLSNTSIAGNYASAKEMMPALGASSVALACFSQSWTRFALGRPVGKSDEETLNFMSNKLGLNAKEAMKYLATSAVFRTTGKLGAKP